MLRGTEHRCSKNVPDKRKRVYIEEACIKVTSLVTNRNLTENVELRQNKHLLIYLFL